MIKKDTFREGFNFLKLSLYAFAGLGMEVLLSSFIDPIIFRDSSNSSSIPHWILTCIIWGSISYILIKTSKEKYSFNIFSYKDSIGLLNWVLSIGILVISLVISFINWNGFKVWKEFLSNGLLKFTFQYIYYLFETTLFVLIIVFAQRCGEIWFNKKNIPWGGIFVALTWGLAHIFTKGELIVGIGVSIHGLLYGIAYLVSKKNLNIAYPLILLMFIL